METAIGKKPYTSCCSKVKLKHLNEFWWLSSMLDGTNVCSFKTTVYKIFKCLFDTIKGQETIHN